MAGAAATGAAMWLPLTPGAQAVAGPLAAVAETTARPPAVATRSSRARWGAADMAPTARSTIRHVPATAARPAARAQSMRRSRSGGGRGAQKRAARVPLVTLPSPIRKTANPAVQGMAPKMQLLGVAQQPLSGAPKPGYSPPGECPPGEAVEEAEVGVFTVVQVDPWLQVKGQL